MRTTIFEPKRSVVEIIQFITVMNGLIVLVVMHALALAGAAELDKIPSSEPTASMVAT